jgi:hypothetical protein
MVGVLSLVSGRGRELEFIDFSDVIEEFIDCRSVVLNHSIFVIGSGFYH